MKIKKLKKSRAKRSFYSFPPQHMPLPPLPQIADRRAVRTPDLLSSSSVPTMRIRRRASRLLGSAYSMPAAPPPVLLAPTLIPKPCPAPLTSQDLGGFLSSATNPEGLCELSRSPWELLDDLSLSDPEEVDDFLDSYCVNLDSHACHLSSASMAVTSVKNKEKMAMAIASSDKAQLQTPKKKKTSKKATMKVSTQKNANVKKEEGEEGATQTWKCKKNDSKGWKCPRNAIHPNSLCEYHLMKKRSCLNLEFASPMEEDKVMVASSKTPSSSNTQKKEPSTNYDATEGFYYYNGFGQSQSKRRRKNHPMKEAKVEVEPSKFASPPNHAKVEIEDGTNNGATTGNDDVRNNNTSGRNNVNMERNKNQWKLPRKPVRVRSLMSL